MVRALTILVPALVLCHAAGASAATASGRHWQVSIDRIECVAAGSPVTIALQVRYLGPAGVAEAPVSLLTDGNGRTYLPKSLVWTSGSKPFAALLAAGGLKNLQQSETAGVQLRFEAGEASGGLKLEFGDIEAISIARPKGRLCESLLDPRNIQAPRKPRPALATGEKARARVYRETYPCRPEPAGGMRIIDAQYPPYLPEQLLLFGRGYLPNARQVDLPMGKAPAQSYAYAGVDELGPIEDAARRAFVADFPGYVPGLSAAPGGQPKYFALNWGVQRAASGNEIYSIGIYALRPCQK